MKGAKHRYCARARIPTSRHAADIRVGGPGERGIGLPWSTWCSTRREAMNESGSRYQRTEPVLIKRDKKRSSWRGASAFSKGRWYPRYPPEKEVKRLLKGWGDNYVDKHRQQYPAVSPLSESGIGCLGESQDARGLLGRSRNDRDGRSEQADG